MGTRPPLPKQLAFPASPVGRSCGGRDRSGRSRAGGRPRGRLRSPRTESAVARHPVPCAWACTRSRSGRGSLPLTARSPHPWTEQGESAPRSRPSEGRPGIPFRVPCRTPPRPDPRLPGTGPRGPRHVFAGLCAVLTTRASSQPRSRRHPAPSIQQNAPSPQPSTRSRFYRDDVLLYNQKGHIHVCSQPCEKKKQNSPGTRGGSKPYLRSRFPWPEQPAREQASPAVHRVPVWACPALRARNKCLSSEQSHVSPHRHLVG